MRQHLRKLLFPWRDVVTRLFDPLVERKDENLLTLFVPLALWIFVVWIVTVPVHELLHAAGCVLFGGSVTELQIKTLYGGALLERVFPFVTSGSEYAGQLTGFDTNGSDLCYFATDYLPFLLTVILGVPMLVLARYTRTALIHAIGFVQIVVAFASIPGDFYEMGSIVLTRTLGFAANSVEAELLRGDDVFVVASEVREAGMVGGAGLVFAALALGIVFLSITLAASLAVGRRLEQRLLQSDTVK